MSILFSMKDEVLSMCYFFLVSNRFQFSALFSIKTFISKQNGIEKTTKKNLYLFLIPLKKISLNFHIVSPHNFELI